MRSLTDRQWNRVLEYCQALDVETGETPEYAFSVRKKTGVLTVWTQEGWKAGWYQARVIPNSKNEKIYLKREIGTAPKEHQWTKNEIDAYIKDLIERVVTCL